MNELAAIQKILAWQTARILGYEDENTAKNHAVLFHVDFDTGLFTPVMIGREFRNSLLPTEHGGNWNEAVEVIIHNFVMDRYAEEAAVFFSEEAARKRFSKGRCYDSLDYLSGIGIPSASRNETAGDTVKWTHCVQYLYEETPEQSLCSSTETRKNHLISWFWIMEVDSYQRNINALRFVARHDQLTGLYNRHMLSELVRDDTPGILILLDVNEFKSINDRYGHAAGDEALRALARRLETIFYYKQTDLIFRMGGDEFLVVMTDNDEERAIDCLRSLQEEIVCGSIRFSVSAGYAVNENDFRASLKRADAALYCVKENGRSGFMKG
ncbi:MAG: GGDEF domain-containing protein [Oscillospiraceae bacterium]|nr:GGDEF domain-containing protein [Oscillospiraceae bacterium]